ncbi:MAG: hypothetical protein ABIQ44_12640 [Chloroflexia bacterium]
MGSASPTRTQLIRVVSEMAQKYRDDLEARKAHGGDLSRPDFIWHSFLQGMATMGNANGYAGLIENPENYQQVTFDRLVLLSPEDRLAKISEILGKAKVRWARSKAAYLSTNVDRILELGGLEVVRDILVNSPGREGKIKFLASFAGIGPKYARSVLMDTYHEDFRDSLALDSRIQKVTNALGLTFPNYQSHEDFYIEAAHEAGINGWEMDRILYNYTNEVLQALAG